MKDIIVLEINSKKDLLGNAEISTPNEFLLVNDTLPIINNRIFDSFLNDIFIIITEELINEFDEKINNVYATFINDHDEFICSAILDKFKPKKGKYRVRIIDWKSTGYTFKYTGREKECEDVRTSN